MIRRARTDAGAFRELYDRYAEPLVRFVQRRTGDREAALDIVAETFCQAWQGLSRFEDRRDGSAGPWLFGIARNVPSRAARDRRLQLDAAAALGVTLRATHVDPGPVWVEGLEADLEAALASLPAGTRHAVQMRVVGDRSYDDIATELDCSPGAARIRVSRGLALLRSQLTTKPEETS